ncbi:unnamed protein product [Caretta caretta]
MLSKVMRKRSIVRRSVSRSGIILKSMGHFCGCSIATCGLKVGKSLNASVGWRNPPTDLNMSVMTRTVPGTHLK